MVALLHNPLSIFIIAIASAFALGAFNRLNKGLSLSLFYVALFLMALVTVLCGSSLEAPITIQTVGFIAPLSINLQFGYYEAFFLVFVNIGAFLGAIYLTEYLKEHALGRALYIIFIMGINGIIMTRDLFNLFIFIEIMSIATYGLIGLDRNIKSLSAGFKYILAGGMLSTFFLLGTALIYYSTGVLNIDTIIAHKGALSSPIGVTAIVMLFTALIVELKPFPANGWGLDVYQGATPGVSAMIAVGVSTAALFALYKLLPLFPAQHFGILVGIGISTFVFSNLMGIKQTDAQRLLGYSSIGQLGLILAALPFFASSKIEFFLGTVGGLFVSHFLAKAILFWIAGIVEQKNIKDWGHLTQSKGLTVLFILSVFSLLGLPPLPGFWAKWQFVMFLGYNGHSVILALVLLGSLFEAVYLLRWFNYILGESSLTLKFQPLKRVPTCLLGLVMVGLSFALAKQLLLLSQFYVIVMVVAAVIMIAGNFLNAKLRAFLAFIGIICLSYYVNQNVQGIQQIFAQMFLWGGLILSISTFYKKEAKPARYGLLFLMLASLGGLVLSSSTLDFFFSWEIMTISSYLLIVGGKYAKKAGLSYIIFSLASASLLMAGFALSHTNTFAGFNSLVGTQGYVVFALLISGFLIKMGAFGVHIWVPGAYAESDDDISTFISTLLSKAGVYGLFMIAIYFQSKITNSPISYVLGWIGILTAAYGALMAAFQEDVKKLLAYSSMGQVGYIVTAIALMSHLGWVAAFYLSINHILYKSLLFLSVAGVIYRVGTRDMYKMGGLIKKMPISYVSAMIGIIAMSGVPPLSGFGGKWLLYTSLIEKGWHFQAVVAFFASGVAFLYMYRLLHSIFLGQAKLEHKDVKEAPLWLIIPQLIFMVLVMVGSMLPRLWVEKLSQVTSEYMGSTLAWSGQQATTSLGHWNGFMVMNVVGVIFIVLLIFLFLTVQKVQKVKQFNIVFAAERPFTPKTTHVAYNLYAPVRKALGGYVRPRATWFWNHVSEIVHTLSNMFTGLYTGNGQTYALFILLFFLILNYLIGAN